MKSLVPALLALAWAMGVARANGQVPDSLTFVGVLVDGSVGTPIAGALVTLRPGGRQAISDSTGTFRFQRLAAGPYDLTVRAPGYVGLERGITASAGRASVTLQLAPDPLAIPGITVRGDEEVSLVGIVRDARSGAPLPYVSLWVTPDAVRRVAEGASGTDGVFSIDDVRVGRYLIGARLAGYVPQYTSASALPDATPTEVLMQPDSLVQAGVEVMQSEMRTRRNAFPGIARAFGPKEINRFGRRRALDFVIRDTGVVQVPCDGLGMCVMNRGRAVQPALIIDDYQVCGVSPLDVLASRPPTDFYTIEVFMGPLIIVRAYTHEYVQREGRRQALNPSVLPPTIQCLGNGGLEAPRRAIPRLSDTLSAAAPPRR